MDCFDLSDTALSPSFVSATKAWSERLQESYVLCQEEDDKAHLRPVKFLYVDGYKCLSAEMGGQTVRVWNVDSGEAVCELGSGGVVPRSCFERAVGAVTGSFFEHILSTERSSGERASKFRIWSQDESAMEVAGIGAITNVVVIVMKDRVHNIQAYLWDYSFAHTPF